MAERIRRRRFPVGPVRNPPDPNLSGDTRPGLCPWDDEGRRVDEITLSCVNGHDREGGRRDAAEQWLHGCVWLAETKGIVQNRHIIRTREIETRTSSYTIRDGCIDTGGIVRKIQPSLSHRAPGDTHADEENACSMDQRARRSESENLPYDG